MCNTCSGKNVVSMRQRFEFGSPSMRHRTEFLSTSVLLMSADAFASVRWCHRLEDQVISDEVKWSTDALWPCGDYCVRLYQRGKPTANSSNRNLSPSFSSLVNQNQKNVVPELILEYFVEITAQKLIRLQNWTHHTRTWALQEILAMFTRLIKISAKTWRTNIYDEKITENVETDKHAATLPPKHRRY